LKVEAKRMKEGKLFRGRKTESFIYRASVLGLLLLGTLQEQKAKGGKGREGIEKFKCK
jgi:hypothetical protein